MLGLLNTFMEICLLRAGPQALPRSASWALLALAAYVLGYAWQLRVTGSPEHALQLAVLDSALTAVVVMALLRWRDLAGRTLQTLFAFYGTGVVLLLLSTPLARWALMQDDAVEPVRTLSLVGLLVILFWSLAIVAHIYRHALGVRFAWGLLIALIYFLGWWKLQAALFPKT